MLQVGDYLHVGQWYQGRRPEAKRGRQPKPRLGKRWKRKRGIIIILERMMNRKNSQNQSNCLLMQVGIVLRRFSFSQHYVCRHGAGAGDLSSSRVPLAYVTAFNETFDEATRVGNFPLSECLKAQREVLPCGMILSS